MFGMMSMDSGCPRVPEKLVPKTAVLSNSFMLRAFAIWGHSFIAHILLVIIPAIVYAFIIN